MAGAALAVRNDAEAGVGVRIDGAVREIARAIAEGAQGVRALPSALIRRIPTADAVYHVAGRLLTTDDDGTPAIVVVVERRAPEPPSEAELRARFRLTRKESEVALLLAEGLQNVEIAARLSVSPHTARHHTANVMAKLETSRREAVRDILNAAFSDA
jgi:DNA-binding CsgD family transcriptional regulator